MCFILHPPDHALVLCVDEKSQMQALERTQPVLPMGLGYVEGVTHDYYRHGTTTLFAAVDGGVISPCKPRHRHQEFLSFFETSPNIPAALQLHLIAYNYASHKPPKVKGWLASNPRFHLHSTFTYQSWLNQYRPLVRAYHQQAIRRGSFRRPGTGGGSTPTSLTTMPTNGPSSGLPPRLVSSKLQRICKVINGTEY
jgi:hypothetical protein